MRTPSHTWLPFCLVLVISYFAFFHQLGLQPMHLWDESSYALNAQEMLETGNPIEVKLLGADDLYNTKPPFAIWAMAISVKFFGFNELGARMASAVFGFLSCIVLFGLGLKVFKNGWSALALPLVLASSYGFVGEHIARTGDTDSILAFWILLQSVLLLGYTHGEVNSPSRAKPRESTSNKQANTYIILTGIAFSMGCLTKGIAGLSAVPGMLAWVLYSRKFKLLFQTPGFYITIVLFVVLVPGYYMLRNTLTPGYWDTVWHFEVGGRLAQQEFLNPEPRPFWYFYKMMFAEDRLLQWIFILPLSVGVIVWSKPSKERTAGLALLFILTGVSFSLGLSQTKLYWYDAPLYPLIAAVIGISFGLLVHPLSHKYFWLFGCFFIWPFYKVVSRNHLPANGTHVYDCITQLRNNGHQNDTIFIINADPNFIVQFYSKLDNLNGYKCEVVFPNDSLLRSGNYILTEKYAREVDMNKLYILDTLFRYEECSYYRIIDKR